MKYTTLAFFLLVFHTGKTQSTDCDTSIHVPSVMSPNSDGFQDCLEVKFTGQVPVRYKFGIYNRWGNLMFETTDPDACWDGSYNKEQCPEGTYFWIMQYKMVREEAEKTCQGNVTLIR